MKRILLFLSLLLSLGAHAQWPGYSYPPASAGGGGGSGTVTAFSCATANGVSCTVANPSTTPTATFTLGAITPSTVNGNTISAGTTSGTNTGDQTITLTGDVTGSGTGSFATTLATVNGNVGSFTNANITVNAKGLITAAANGASLTLSPTAVKTGAYNAIVGDFVPVDTTSGSVTITLPTAPTDRAQIGVKQVIRGGTNTVTVAAGGSDVFNTAGGPTTRTLTVTGAAQIYQYQVSTGIWFVIADDLPLGSLLANAQTWTGVQTFVGPVLGAATATTVNKVTLTAPATGATLTIADGTTLNAGAGGTIGALGYLTPGTGVATAAAINVGSAGAFLTFNGAGGTPSSLTGTNITGTASGLTAGNVTTNANLTGDVTSVGNATTLATVNSNVGIFGSATQVAQVTLNGKGLTTAGANVTITPAVGSVTGLGTGVATALGVNVGTAGAFVTNGGALGTPSSGVATNLTGTAASLTAGNVTTNANLTGPITSVGNTTSIASQTGTGTKFVVDTSPTLVTPILGVASGTSYTTSGTAGTGFHEFTMQSSAPSTPASNAFRLYSDASGRLSWKGSNGFVRTFDGTANTADRVYTLPDAAGTITVLGNASTGSGSVVLATSPTLVTPALGTPSSGTLTNATGLPAAGVVGTAAILGANTFTAGQTINPAANTSAAIISGGSITGSGTTVPGITVAGTLNTSGTVAGAVLFGNITNTASNAATTLAELQTGGTSLFKVRASDGRVTIGTGTTSQAGVVLGYSGTSSYGGMWAGNTTPDVNSGILFEPDASKIYLRASAGVHLGINGVNYFSLASGSQLVMSSAMTFGWNSGSASTSSNADTILTRSAAATIQQGAANAASPVAQILQAQGSRSGTDTNVGGASYTLQSGNGTGTGTLSSLILQSPVAVGSGTGAQTQTAGLTIKGGQAVSTAYTVSTLPTGITGGRAHVTDAVACTFLASLTGGSSTVCPVFYNGTAWVGG